MGDDQVPATFDAEQFASDKLAAVQYLRFALPASAQRALARPGMPLRLRIEHPAYRHHVELGEAGRAELAPDLV